MMPAVGTPINRVLAPMGASLNQDKQQENKNSLATALPGKKKRNEIRNFSSQKFGRSGQKFMGRRDEKKSHTHNIKKWNRKKIGVKREKKYGWKEKRCKYKNNYAYCIS